MGPKDVSNKRFEKSAFGYKPEEVDNYLREVAVELAQLQKAKEEADKKIDVLADKVREYLRDEEALKDALLGAQRQGKQVVEDSKVTAAQIIGEANRRADEIIGQTRIQLEREEAGLAGIQKEVADFKAQLLALYRQHLDLITAMPDVEESQESNAQEESEETDESVNGAGYSEARFAQ